MVALRPVSLKIEQRLRLPKVVAILVTYVLVIAALVLVVIIVVPPLVVETQNFIRSFSGTTFFAPIQSELQNFTFSLQNLDSLLNRVGQSLPVLFQILGSAFSSVFAVFTTLVISMYMLLDYDRLPDRIHWLTKNKKYRRLTAEFISDIEEQLGGWVRSQLVLMLLIGVVTYFGLLVLGVPYALPLALLAGLLEVLPNLGPTLAAIPAVAVGVIFGGPAIGLAVLIFYIVVQQLEANLIVPKIMQANVNVSPLATIITILVGLQAAGVVGAMLSVPIYIVIRTLYRYWFDHLR